MKFVLLVGLGGAMGSILRYITTLIVAKAYGTAFPLATLCANMLGCFIIGIIMGYVAQDKLPPELKFFLITGFCGGYTTFSAFSLENIQLIQQNQWASALSYSVISIILGMMLVFAGMMLVKQLS